MQGEDCNTELQKSKGAWVCDVELIHSKNTFRQGVSNDGGSHVETSSICAVPLGIIVVGESGTALVSV